MPAPQHVDLQPQGPLPPKQLTSEHLAELAAARKLLENPGITAKLTNLVGMPIQKGIEALPGDWREKIGMLTRSALLAALKTALLTMDARDKGAFPRLHKLMATVSGGVGGMGGLPALAAELPISTVIMLRSIAAIGRTQGEDLTQLPARLACLEVLALGGTTPGDDASDSGYYAVRAALARTVTEAMQYIAAQGVAEEGAPAIVRLVAAVAARFQVQVSEKAAAMAIPMVGAAGGALINYLFIDHFQDMSRGHFTVRRLERIYGPDAVRDAYDHPFKQERD